MSVAVDAEAMVTRIGALQEEGTETSPDLNASPLAVASVLSSPSLVKGTPFLQEEARDKLRHGQNPRSENSQFCEEKTQCTDVRRYRRARPLHEQNAIRIQVLIRGP